MYRHYYVPFLHNNFCANIVLGGVGIGLSSLDQLLQALPPNALPSLLEELIHAGHSHGHSHGPITGADPLALWVAGGSIGIKEWLFRATKKIAVETNSTVLLANVCFWLGAWFSGVG